MLNDQQKARLAELTAKKKKSKLEGAEWTEFKELSRASKDSGSDGRRKDGKSERPSFKPGNDFSWWNKVPDLMKDAANLKANWLPGTRLKVGLNVGIPGVAGIDMFDVYGIESASTGPLNLMARDIFLKMFRKYRGITAYQSSDLGMVLIASIEVISYFAALERIYGIINRYSKLNQNMPYAELLAMGINHGTAEWIRNHLSDFRYQLNTLIRKAQRLCVPKDLSILADKIALYGSEYLDHNSAKGQILVFNKKWLGVFNETGLPTGSSVMFQPIDDNYGIEIFDEYIYSSLFPMLEEAINALVGSDSVQKIYGDLMTWFGEDAMITLLPMPDDYVVEPVYSESILHKFHNVDVLGLKNRVAHLAPNCVPTVDDAVYNAMKTLYDISSMESKNGYVIYQDNNVIVSQIGLINSDFGTFEWGSGTFKGRIIQAGPIANQILDASGLPYRLLDSYHEEFSDEVVCEGALWKCYIEQQVSGESAAEFISSCATEICGDINVITQLDPISATGSTVTSGISNFVQNALLDLIRQYTVLTVFDWAPILYSLDGIGSMEDPLYLTAVSGDIDNCRLIEVNDHYNIVRAALYSCFKSDLQVIS